MHRRNLLKGVAALPLLALGPSGPARSAPAATSLRRVRPGDAGWPTAADGQKLNDAVGGALLPGQALLEEGHRPRRVGPQQTHRGVDLAALVAGQVGPQGFEVRGGAVRRRGIEDAPDHGGPVEACRCYTSAVRGEIDVDEPVVVHDHPSVDHDARNRSAVFAVDELVDRVVQWQPIWVIEVEHDDVGLVAGCQPPEAIAKSERAGTAFPRVSPITLKKSAGIPRRRSR